MVRRVAPLDADWHQVQYMIFDLPQATEPFAERAQRIQTVLAQAKQPWLQAVPHQRVADAHSLQTLLRSTVQAGGEGLVLHRANALWSPGRSDALFKLKPLPDEDARVVGHLPGKGRHAGRLGALLLEMPDGQRFALGTGFTDAQRTDPPAVGSVVTYRYRDRTPKGFQRLATVCIVSAGAGTRVRALVAHLPPTARASTVMTELRAFQSETLKWERLLCVTPFA
jgi:DNA ligase-1